MTIRNRTLPWLISALLLVSVPLLHSQDKQTAPPIFRVEVNTVGEENKSRYTWNELREFCNESDVQIYGIGLQISKLE